VRPSAAGASLMIVIRPAQDEVVKKFSLALILSQSDLIFSSHCCSWDLSFFVSAFCFSNVKLMSKRNGLGILICCFDGGYISDFVTRFRTRG